MPRARSCNIPYRRATSYCSSAIPTVRVCESQSRQHRSKQCRGESVWPYPWRVGAAVRPDLCDGYCIRSSTHRILCRTSIIAIRRRICPWPARWPMPIRWVTRFSIPTFWRPVPWGRAAAQVWGRSSMRPHAMSATTRVHMAVDPNSTVRCPTPWSCSLRHCRPPGASRR